MHAIGDVVFCDFPKTDASGFQDRTVLLVADVFGDDVIGCMVTTTKSKFDSCIELCNEHMAEGRMPNNPSYIRPVRLATINSRYIRRKVGTVKDDVLVLVKKEIRKKFE